MFIRRRESLKPLKGTKINKSITERDYQLRAIRRISESFELKKRKALLVMATGTGKTRTVISLCDLLIRCNWVKRVLFLADRTALVNQAEKAFKAHLPDCSPVNLVSNRKGVGRVFLSTYPTISNLIDSEDKSGEKCFGVGHFDLVIIDEAHRSIYQKYSSIFDYFDSLLVGLTATPKEEIDRNTYGLFDLDIGVIQADSWYDRAALIAIEPSKRENYVDQIRKQTKLGAVGLLITFAYPQEQMQGPPYALHDDDVTLLFSDGFELECLEKISGYPIQDLR